MPPAALHSVHDAFDLHQAIEVLTFRAGFNTTLVVLGVTLLGVAAGVAGLFAVLRRRAMMSDVLSHATLPGIAAAFLAAVALGLNAKSLPVLLGGAAVGGIVGVLCVQAIVRYSRLHEDTAMGVVLSVLFGLGMVLLTHIQGLSVGNQAGLATFIFGQAAAMGVRDTVGIAAVALSSILVALLLFKEFRLACFDSEFARVQGWPVATLDLAMMGLVTVVTVIGLYAVGLILIVALLVIPPTAARFWTDSLRTLAIASALIGALSGYLGASVSAMIDGAPTGPVIVLVAGGVFLFSILFAPRRGLLAAALRLARSRLRIRRDHLLRTLYEAGAANGAQPQRADAILRSAPPWLRFDARRRGLLQRPDHRWALTDAGREAAARVTRNHRLWEQFLVTHADIAASHVDTAADMVEHVLAPEMVADLERSLDARGMMPERLESVHPLDDGGRP